MHLIKTFRSLSLAIILGAIAPIALMAQQNVPVKATIDATKKMQVMESFGASDAWTCQYAGLWPAAQKNKMADLLFSKATDKNGNPLGIGLDFWRFSIGGGSTEQGKESGIKDEWRRQMSFLKKDGSYDEEGMKGQMWFLNAAKNRGVKYFLGFVNSPHINFTLNGKAFSSDGKCNLDFAKSEAFCADLVNNIKIIKKQTGIELNYLSPVNEPQWKWNDGGQEGCPYDNAQITQLVKTLNTSLQQANLTTKIQVGDAGQLDFLTNNSDRNKSKQIYDFFNPVSPKYIGNLSNVDHSISGHSYFTTSPEDRAIKMRKTLADSISKTKDLRFWMSEYCVLGDATLKGEGRDLGMTTALFIAKLIHHDLTYANATSWQWWLAVSTGNYKDGLVYIDKSKTDGKVYDSKLLWAFGNYSRFIPEGSQRLATTLSNADGIYLSTYVANNKVITVIVNTRKENAAIKLEGVKLKENVQLYTTSATQNLAPSSAKLNHLSLPAESVTTVIAMKK
jgi:O-glycosyl hydrolase